MSDSTKKHSLQFQDSDNSTQRQLAQAQVRLFLNTRGISFTDISDQFEKLKRVSITSQILPLNFITYRSKYYNFAVQSKVGRREWKRFN